MTWKKAIQRSIRLISEKKPAERARKVEKFIKKMSIFLGRGLHFHEFIGYLSITMLKLCSYDLLLIFTGQPNIHRIQLTSRKLETVQGFISYLKTNENF